jgi:hypothetical protein
MIEHLGDEGDRYLVTRVNAGSACSIAMPAVEPGTCPRSSTAADSLPEPYPGRDGMLRYWHAHWNIAVRR